MVGVWSIVAALSVSPPDPCFAQPPLSTPPTTATETSPPNAESAPSNSVASIGTLLIVVGPGGTPEYDRQFAEWSREWRAMGERGGLDVIVVEPSPDQRDRLQQRLDALRDDRSPQAAAATESAADSATAAAEVPATEAPMTTSETRGSNDRARWLVLIGHGSYDGRTARFNLQGPDLEPSDLNEALAGVAGPWVIVQGAASSGPFLEALSAADRVVITATRSGDESSAARWHRHLLDAIADRRGGGDLDQDEQVSVLEAFVSASRGVAAWYAEERRIATEHALLDDDGDGQGATAERLAVPGATATNEGASHDGRLAARIVLIPSAWERERSAEWLARRDRLEQELIEAKLARTAAPDDPTTFARLREVIDRLADHYRAAER
ncbi:MAG TPA: hypothetical protein PLI18_13380 [Pirellulaceae bacterium]|nr:hypothetical protein [Pirellulaceae bacterium]